MDLIVTVSAPAAHVRPRKPASNSFPTRRSCWLGWMSAGWRHEVLTANEAVVPIAIDPRRVVQDIVASSASDDHMCSWSWGPRRSREPGARSWGASSSHSQDRLTFAWSDEQSFAEMLKAAAALPANSAILYIAMTVDAKGFSHSEDPRARRASRGGERTACLACSAISWAAASSAVRCCRWTMWPGTRRRSPFDCCAVNRPRPSRRRTLVAQRPIYDWRELQRWGIARRSCLREASSCFVS